MPGEVRSWWQTRIAQLERDTFFKKRYANCAKEPKALFDRIGEDLDSTNEKIREAAYWILVHLTPELTNILHEKETREPGWRERKGEDQKMVNEGIDGSKCIYKHLHTKFVKEHRFKVLDGHKKDPRPFLKEIMDNWETDEDRKRKNRKGDLIEVPLDYEAAVKIADPAPSVEDSVLENITIEELKSEFRGLGFWRNDDEQDLFYAYHIDDRPLDEFRERLGISSKATSDTALRQWRSRINKNIVAVRDALFTFLLLSGNEFSKRGKIPRFPQDTKGSEEWAQRAKRSVQPGPWVYASGPNGNYKVYLRALTRNLRGKPAHIYLAAIQNDYSNMEQALFWHPKQLGSNSNDPNAPDVLGVRYTACVDFLINATTSVRASRNQLGWPEFARLLHKRYMVRWLRKCSTDIPALNKALAEVPDDYDTWLISNSLPVKSYFS